MTVIGNVKNMFVFLAMVVLIYSGCGTVGGPDSLGTEPLQAGGVAKIKLRTSSSSGPFSTIADSAVAVITGSDMMTISQTLTVTDSSVEGVVESIPSGQDRTVTIFVYDTNQVVRYQGSATTEVIADSVISVDITVTRVRGDVEINGTITDDSLLEGLIAYYPFNDNARDAGTLSNDGTVYGATLTTDRFGRTYSAYLFDGTADYIEVPYDSSLDCEDSLSVVLWAKSSIPGSDYSNYGMIMQMGTGSEAAYGIGLNPNYDLNVIQYDFCGHWELPADSNPDREALDAAIIDGAVRCTRTLDTAWHFYAFTFDGDSLRGYFDSEPVGAKNAITGPIDNLPLRFGVQSKSLDNFWNGKIDDIRLYHRVLSPQEILDLKQLEN